MEEKKGFAEFVPSNICKHLEKKILKNIHFRFKIPVPHIVPAVKEKRDHIFTLDDIHKVPKTCYGS